MYKKLLLITLFLFLFAIFLIPVTTAEVTIGESCLINEDCNDGNFCTQNFCDFGLCIIIPTHDGTACDDNNVCTLSDICIGGECIGGAYLNCNDNNQCTEDSCNTEFGCLYSEVPLGQSCDDGNVCTENNVCSNGVCTEGNLLTCEDGNICTAELCDSELGCASIPVPDNTPTGNNCGIGACWVEASCLAGQETCTPLEPLTEICDGVDNDCDGSVDDGFSIGEYCEGIGQCGLGRLECATLSSTRCSTLPEGSNDQSSSEVCDGNDNDCDGEVDDLDLDNDNVNDCDNDKCLGTILPEIIPLSLSGLSPNHFSDIDGDGIFETNIGSKNNPNIVDSEFSLIDTFGCSVKQILECKPGNNNGELENGCTQGTLQNFINQNGWAKDGVCFNPDSDRDLIPDSIDNCPNDFNPEQEDSDGNGIGDVCDTFSCCTETGCSRTTIDLCRNIGGVIGECLGINEFVITGGDPSPEANVSLRPTNTSVTTGPLAEFIRNLTRDVGTTGVNNTRYNATSYDCDDFAHDLERNLTVLGYNATYTLIGCAAGGPTSGYNFATGYPAFHAITDVHAPDGTIIFIEPQSGRIVNIDFDGDGQVEGRSGEYVYGMGPAQLTDNNCKIHIFEDTAGAAAVGAPRD